MPFDPAFWTDSFNEILTAIVAWLPNLLGALAWLILGLLISQIVRVIAVRLLRRFKLDALSDRAGVTDALKSAGVEISISRLLGRALYWLTMLVFILAAAEALGLSQVVTTLGRFIGYLPNVLAAVLILLFGSLISRIVGDAVGGFSQQVGVENGPIIRQLVRYALLVFVIILAVEQLGIQALLLTSIALVLLVMLALTLTLAFGMGSRELARNIMSGFHAKDTFKIGQSVQVRQHRGVLVSIGSVKSVIETENGLISLPNHILTEEEVLIHADKQES